MHIYLHFVTSNEILLDALFKKNYSRKNHAILTHKFCLKFLIIQVLFYVFIEKKKLIIYQDYFILLQASRNTCERECTRTSVRIFSDTVKR